MAAKWTKDREGDYTLSLPSGHAAWIAKGGGNKSQRPWYGRVTSLDGSTRYVSGWTLRAAKSAAETAMRFK